MNHMHFYFCPLYTHIYYNNDRRFYMNKKQNSLYLQKYLSGFEPLYYIESFINDFLDFLITIIMNIKDTKIQYYIRILLQYFVKFINIITIFINFRSIELFLCQDKLSNEYSAIEMKLKETIIYIYRVFLI